MEGAIELGLESEVSHFNYGEVLKKTQEYLDAHDSQGKRSHMKRRGFRHLRAKRLGEDMQGAR